MPYYDFVCANAHTQEAKMTFSEHSELDKDEKGIYIECNVKYGDLDNPKCIERAYQKFDGNIGVSMNYGYSGRH